MYQVSLEGRGHQSSIHKILNKFSLERIHFSHDISEEIEEAQRYGLEFVLSSVDSES